MDLAYSQPTWTRFLREFAHLVATPLRELWELEQWFTLARERFRNENDYNGNFASAAAIDLAGIDYGVNCTKDGLLYPHLTANGGNWDLDLYRAPGGAAPDKVAHFTNVADGATGALTADNSSGLSGTIKLGAAVVAEANDVHVIRARLDMKKLLGVLLDGSVAEDTALANAIGDRYTRIAAFCAQIRSELRQAESDWNTIRARAFLKAMEQSGLTSESRVPDSDGNVVVTPRGLVVVLNAAMHDDTVAGEQDVLERAMSGGAGVAASSNDGKFTIAAHTPLERAPVGRLRFVCVKGADQGWVGVEEFQPIFTWLDGQKNSDGSPRSEVLTPNLVIKRTWRGPYGLGPLSAQRTFAKTGDGAHNYFDASVAFFSTTGENQDNTDVGTLYWKITGAGPFTYSFYSDALHTLLKAQIAGVAAATAAVAVAQNSSGLSVGFKSGAAPANGVTGTLLLQPAMQANSGGGSDEITVEVTEDSATPGELQKLVGREFGCELNSDTAGNESFSDAYIRAGGYPPFNDGEGY